MPLAEELALGVGEESAFRASVTARPCEVWEAVGVGVGVLDALPLPPSVALSAALSVALPLSEPEGLADGSGVGAPAATVSTGRK